MTNQLAECLAHLMQLETIFVQYRMSSATFFRKIVAESAAKCLPRLQSVLESGPVRRAVLARGIHEDGLRALLSEIAQLADSTTSHDGDDLRAIHTSFGIVLPSVKLVLMAHLGIEVPPNQIFSTDEWSHWQHASRWVGVLPTQMFGANQTPELIWGEASKRRTISVMADIRRSQDLMMYTVSPEGFSERLMRLVSSARSIALKHGGIFDKFTGDGFLVHFNELICEEIHVPLIPSFTHFCEETMKVAEEQFDQWLPELRKVPAVTPGLAMGADIGDVTFLEQGGELIAVGQSVVWASRMVAAATSGEVLTNNLLKVALQKEGTKFGESKAQETKSGESFTAWPIDWKRPGQVDRGSG